MFASIPYAVPHASERRILPTMILRPSLAIMAVYARRALGVALGMAMFPLGLAAAAIPRATEHPRLFFNAEDIVGLRAHGQLPAGQAMVARLEALLAVEPAPLLIGHQAAGWALRYVLGGDPQAAERALALCEDAVADRRPYVEPATGREVRLWHESNPSVARVPLVVGVALAYDLCATAWPAERRTAIARALEDIAGQLLRDGSPDDNAHAAGLEQARMLSAGGLAALAVAGDPGVTPEPAAMARMARNGLARHFAEYGDRGWPHEGFNSLRYALSQGMAAFILAWRHTQGEDLAAQSAVRWFAPLYTMLAIPPAAPADGAGPEVPFFGQGNFSSAARRPYPTWERSEQRGGDMLALFGVTDAGSRAALQWTFDRCFGLAGDRTFDIQKPSDALFALLQYPFGDTALNPGVALSHVWRDDRAGVYFFRNEWDDAADCVAAITANNHPARGLDSFADAGSFRLLALGGRWAVQRQRDRADVESVSREKENVVVIPGTHGWLGGRVTQVLAQPDGSGAISLDLDAVYTVAPPDGRPERLEPTLDLGIRAQRAWAVDYSGVSGAPVLAIVVDRISGGPARRWLLHTQERDVKLRADGFDLRAANGATLHATVIAPAKPRLTVARGEWTDTVAIDGEGDFFVVMTVQSQAAPTVKCDGEGLRTVVRIGGRVVRYDGNGLALD
jgi:hypothetical protein